MTDPVNIAARYFEAYVDDDDRGAVIKDRATGESFLVMDTREQQRLVIRSLNIADQTTERIEQRDPAA